MTQLILKAAATGYYGSIPCVGADCDNNGVVSHGNTSHISLSTNQTQADLLRVFKNLISNQSFTVKYKYVQSHADDSKRDLPSCSGSSNDEGLRPLTLSI